MTSARLWQNERAEVICLVSLPISLAAIYLHSEPLDALKRTEQRTTLLFVMIEIQVIPESTPHPQKKMSLMTLFFLL